MKIRLEIPPGINTDDTAFRYPGTWKDADCVRFWKGVPEVIGGWETVASSTLDGVARSVISWVDLSSVPNIAIGMHNGLNVCQDGTLYDITPSSGFTPGQIDGTGGAGYGTGAYNVGDYSEPSTDAYYPLTWSLSNWGESLMANPRGQGIFWWQNNTGTPAATLTGAPTEVTYTLVNSYRQVMAFGCNEEVSTTFNPMCIRFSNIQDPEDWTTATDNLAGEVILEGSGRIVGATLAGDYVFVWTNTAIYQGTYTGDSAQPWIFQRVGENCGLAGPNAMCAVGQTVFWFSTQGRFYSCSVGGVPNMVFMSVGDDMADNITPSQYDKIVCSPISKFNEIWWFYPDVRDGSENSRYVSLNLTDGSSSRGTLARTAFCDMQAGSNLYPIGIDYDGNIYYHEKGTTADGAERSWFIETSDFFIDEAQQCVMVKCMWPDFQRQTGAIMMTLNGLQYPQSTPEVFADQTLTANTTKIDFRFTGRLIRMRLSGNTVPTDMRLGVPLFELEPAGDR